MPNQNGFHIQMGTNDKGEGVRCVQMSNQDGKIERQRSISSNVIGHLISVSPKPVCILPRAGSLACAHDSYIHMIATTPIPS